MCNNPPYVLSIAGFDPTGGAGVVADCKTFEQHAVFGLSVVSGITWQHEALFEGVEWVRFEVIVNQLRTLAKKYQPKCVKIGLIESQEMLLQVLNCVNELWPSAFIIWDPIIKASSGFDFHTRRSGDFECLIKDSIDLITPNLPEAELLFGDAQFGTIADLLRCAILVKGGHSTSDEVCDYLYQPGMPTFEVKSQKVDGNWQKHGTGCVLSAAICANYALGLSLHEACENAHYYVKNYIASQSSLLGFHAKKGGIRDEK